MLIGADRSAFLAALERHAPGVPVAEVTAGETDDVMAEAVRAALELASPGDVVLLAPAAASMDQFTDYGDRGRRFAEAVRARRVVGRGDRMETDTAIEGPTAPVVPLFGKRRAPTFRIALPPLPKVGTGNYYALGAVTLFLAVFGLVMVLSASSVEQGQDLGNPYGDFGKQAMAEGVGIAAMLLVSRARPRLLLVAAPYVFAGAIVLQLLTVLTPLGTSVNGNRNWIRIAGTSVQPSEFVKLGLVLVLAAFFARRKAERLGRARGLAPVLLPSRPRDRVGAARQGPRHLADHRRHRVRRHVLRRRPLAGARRLRRARASAVMVVMAATRGSRVDRILAWGSGCNNDLLGTCWQSTQATWALANGGLFGVGIGNSVSKWFWLPEADNDFILAIIGEETGLVGLTVLLALLRRADRRRAAHLHEHPRPVHPGRVGDGARVARRAGLREHRRRARHRAGLRGAAALHLVRRILDDRQPARRRLPDGAGQPGRRSRAPAVAAADHPSMGGARVGSRR